MTQIHNFRRIVGGTSLAMWLSLAAFSPANAQDVKPSVDPNLISIVETIKSRTAGEMLRTQMGVRETAPEISIFLAEVDKVFGAVFSKDADKISDAVQIFESGAFLDQGERYQEITKIFADYANANQRAQTSSERPAIIQAALKPYGETDDWFAQFIALNLSSYEFAEDLQRTDALQTAQAALALIPRESTAYADFARIRLTELISQLHNLQSNKDLAILTTAEYLRLTEHNYKPEVGLDLLNNLLFSHSNWRDHAAQAYLSAEILEIEKKVGANLPGLTELRIAKAKNDSAEFSDGLKYAIIAEEKSDNKSILLQARKNQALSLAGLGRSEEAREMANAAGQTLNRHTLLTGDVRNDVLHFEMLMALNAGDNELAVHLVNRRLDLHIQKLLAANTRDTDSLLASLENSRERQAEREAAAARESALQALTIKKQRRLNWVLAVLSSLLAICALLAVIFARYRNRISKELAIKTKEAASADKLKTDFLGMISHELRTPLNGIIGISDLLAHHYPDPDVRHKTSIVLDSGNQLLNVVSSITDMATVEAGKMEVYPHGSDIPSLLAETIAECQDKADKKSLAFTQFIDPELHIHATDGQRLQQCVFNLLDNAIKFTDEGRVHLHVTAQKDETGHITGLRAIVADTGQGMSELVQSRLFTPFMQADSSMTRKFGGAGLNLAVTRALARLMDGDLTMVSREGRGSEFTLDLDFATSITLDAADPISTSVTQVAEAPSILDMQMSDIIDDTPLTTDGAVIDLMLPTASDTPALHSATVEVEPTTPSTKISDLTGLRILLVDDIESNRDIVRMMLEAEGCICFDAANGEDAITALHAGPIDIVMMDIRMPVMDGVEATRAIRQSDTPFARVPIIALTADSEAQTNAACMAAGADIFLTKPIMAHELTRALRFLRASGQSRLLSAV